MSIKNRTVEPAALTFPANGAFPASGALPADGTLPANGLEQLCDADLLDAWQQDRSRQALAALVDRYAVMVLSVCRRRCRSVADADDAFQSTFLYLAESGHKIRDPARLPGWLHRVAQRAAVATVHRAERSNEPIDDLPTEPDNPLERLTQRHEAIVLDEELADLPEHYRAALVLHLLEGRTVASLAEQLGTTTGSVRGHLQRGKSLLARRLRRRGVVPVMAFAAAGACTVSRSAAATAAIPLGCTASPTPDTAPPELTDPPIDLPLLQSLIAKGTRTMPTLYVAGSLAGGAGMLALMFLGGPPTGGNEPTNSASVVELPAVAAQIAGGSAFSVPAGGGTSNDAAEAGTESEAGQGGGIAQVASGTESTSGSSTARAGDAQSEVAKRVRQALDGQISVNFGGGNVEEFAGAISSNAGVPVLVEPRALEVAGVTADSKLTEFSVSSAPLRTVLRRALRPYGLQATIEDEGLVITADYAALAHRGIATERWLDVSPKVAEQREQLMEQKVSFSFTETPLEDAVKAISEQVSFPILIDRRALEGVALTTDAPVSLRVKDVSLRSALKLMLGELELTYTMQDEVLKVTSIDAAHDNLRERLYWLEGTGIPRGDFDSIMRAIQTTIVPDTWEALGGPSTMFPLQSGDGNRPSLLVSTTDEVHAQIKSLLDVMRQSHLGPDPVASPRKEPARGTMGGSYMGGRYMGGSDMGMEGNGGGGRDTGAGIGGGGMF